VRVYEPPARTSVATIERHGQLACPAGRAAGAVAQAWTDAGFGDELTARWLDARCFDARAARALTFGVTPEQAAARTRAGEGGYIDTIGFKVASADLTVRQGAARSLSSR